MDFYLSPGRHRSDPTLLCQCWLQKRSSSYQLPGVASRPVPLNCFCKSRVERDQKKAVLHHVRKQERLRIKSVSTAPSGGLFKVPISVQQARQVSVSEQTDSCRDKGQSFPVGPNFGKITKFSKVIISMTSLLTSFVHSTNLFEYIQHAKLLRS